MRSKGADPGSTLEGDGPEDECGVSSSVPHNGGVTPAKWFSLSHPSNMRQQAFPNHAEMLYVNLEESCPSSPTYLERDPNMSCTARYSPASYPSTTSNLGVSQSSSLNTTPLSSSNGAPSQSNLVVTQQYPRPEEGEGSHNLLQYQALGADRFAPLLQVYEGVTVSCGTPYYPSTATDTFGVSSSDGGNVTNNGSDQTNSKVSTTVCDQTSEVNPSVYMPTNQQSLPTSTTHSNIEQTQLMDNSQMQFILTSDCGYHMMQNSKSDHVELFIARDPSGTAYSVTSENGFLIARPTLSTCSVKPESVDSEVNSIPVDVSMLDSLDDATQFDEEHHNIVMETEPLSSPNLDFNQSDELILHSDSNDVMSPSHLEEVECGQIVDFEEIAEYLGSQPSTPTQEEIFTEDIPLEKNRPNRRRQQQLDNAIMCIPDKSVPCRARASLPATHLSLKAGPESSVVGVFTKRRIPIRARFGPLEGCKKKIPRLNIFSDCHSSTNQAKFIVRTKIEDLVIDVSDERTSNWMCFVRFEPGPLQNVCLHQSDDELFFITCRPIAPKQELILGYGIDYAKQWGLPSPPNFAAASEETSSEWPCYECSLGFSSSSELQAHLNSHDKEEKAASIKRPKKKLSKGINNTSTSYPCDFCNKSFSTVISLKRHMIVHDQVDDKNYEIQSFSKTPYQDLSSDIEQIDLNNCIIIKNESNYNLKDDRIANMDSYPNVQPTEHLSLNEFKREPPHRLMEREQLVPDSQMDNDSLDSLNVEETYGTVQKINMSHVNEEVFTCVLCNKILDNAMQLEMHNKEHESSKAKSIPCPSCPTESLNSIIKVENKNAKNVGGNRTKVLVHCPVCPKTFKNGPLLKDHVQNYHMRADGKYECPMCSMVLPDYRNVKKHMRVYHALKKMSCDECGSNFATNDKLRLHMLKHSDRRDFVCGECGKQFKRRDKLKEHAKKQHSGDGKPVKAKESCVSPTGDPTAYLSFTYKCHPCKRGFKRRGMLVNHLAKRHPDVVRTTVPELQMPILRVARNYYCQYCDKVYKSSSKRKAHIIKNHPGESVPPSARGSSSVEIKEGFSKYVGAVPSAPHGCPHQPCHKQYASRAKLLQHIRLKHQIIESKESKKNKSQSHFSKADISTSILSSSLSKGHDNIAGFTDSKMKPNKVPYQEYDSVSEKMVVFNPKSKMDQTPQSNGKILSNLLINGHPSQDINESSNKSLAEFKLNEYLKTSSSKQPCLTQKNVWQSNAEPPALINSARNASMRLQIIQLSDGTQIIEEADIQMELAKKSFYGKIPGQLMMENIKLPPVSVLAGNSNKGCYTDR